MVWAAFVFVLSSIPGTRFPQVDVANADKLVHGAIYLLLGALCLHGVRRSSALVGARAVVMATCISALYGVTDELHQIFTPFRSPDWHDVVADAAGGLMGALAATALLRRRRSRRRAARVERSR
jgi:VanZ family protein